MQKSDFTLLVINRGQDLGVYQSLPRYEVEFVFFPYHIHIIRKKFDSLFTEKKLTYIFSFTAELIIEASVMVFIC